MVEQNPKPGLRYSFPFAVCLVVATAGLFGFAAILFFTSAYTINPGEVGVILRFGEYRETVNSGLRFRAPLGIDQVFKLPVDRELKVDFGTHPVQPESGADSPDHKSEGLLFIAGDLREVTLDWTTTYMIADPVDYMFKNRGIFKLFQDMNEACMNDVVSSVSSEELLADSNDDFGTLVAEHLQERCDKYETGIAVVSLKVQSIRIFETVE